jgi:hypothetical protein
VKVNNAVTWLSWLIVVLALVATGVGLLWPYEGSPFTFTTLRGESVEIWGQGWYRYDTPLIALGFMAGDGVMLLLGIPLLVISLLRYRRRSLKGGLLLVGMLAYFVYAYGSMTFGAAYNNLFLVYTILFAASLFAFVLAFTSIEPQAVSARILSRLPRRSLAAYLLVTGVVLVGVWGGLSLLPALLQGKAPVELASYTTLVTHAIDLGIIAPLSILAGILLLRRFPLGYVCSFTILVLSWTIGTSVVVGGVVQLLAQVLTIDQVLGFVIPFIILNLVGIWLTFAFLRNLSDVPQGQATHGPKSGKRTAKLAAGLRPTTTAGRLRIATHKPVHQQLKE